MSGSYVGREPLIYPIKMFILNIVQQGVN